MYRNDVIPGLDVNDAIGSHLEWGERLRALVDGTSNERLDASVVARDDACALGKWIHGRANRQHAQLPEYASLRDSHAQLHACACNVLMVQQQGNPAAAKALLNGALQQASGAFKHATLDFLASAARQRSESKRGLALSSGKISRAIATRRILWTLMASLGATLVLKAVLFGEMPNSAGWRVGLADVLMLLAVACPALYFAVLRPLYGAVDHLRYAEDDLRTLDAAIETQPPMLIADANGMILKVNHAFTGITGFGAEDVVGQTPRLLKSGKQDAGFYEQMWKSIADAGAWQGALWNKRKDGREFRAHLAIAAVPGPLGKAVLYVATLEDRTGAGGALLEKDAAESDARSRSEFMTHVGHQLRTPLNAMLGFADLALHEPLDPRLRGYLERIRDSGRTLVGRVEDLLELTRIESGEIELGRIAFDLTEVCTTARRTATILASGKSVRVESSFDPGIPARLLGDPVRIAKIADGLLGNAVKFTESGTVAITLALQRLSQGIATIGMTVRDTGIGMDDTLVARVFRQSSRDEDAARRRIGGAGLGLVIVKSLVAQMGGTIAVESSPGQGSSFHVVLSLPVAPEAAGAPPAGKASEWAGIQEGRYSGKRLLVAEDDEANQELFRLIFETYGFSVDIAPNGREAVRRVAGENAPYDLVLMDIMMPEMGGLEATRIIRATHPMDVLPIVALTAHASEEDRQLSLNAGMNEHLVKPLELERTNKVLERLLG